MSFFTPPPMNAPVFNGYGVQTGSIVDGRVLDRFGYDSGLRLNGDWTFSTREGFRTPLGIDPLTGRIGNR